MWGLRMQDVITRALIQGELTYKSVDIWNANIYIYIFVWGMFYQLLRIQHSCSSTQSWGSVLPSIVETRDQNSQSYPLLFSNRNLGSFCAQGTEILLTHSFWEVVDHSRSKMHETCLIIIHYPSMRPGPESNRGPLD